MGKEKLFFTSLTGRNRQFQLPADGNFTIAECTLRAKLNLSHTNLTQRGNLGYYAG